jgi:hypothetical protein
LPLLRSLVDGPLMPGLALQKHHLLAAAASLEQHHAAAATTAAAALLLALCGESQGCLRTLSEALLRRGLGELLLRALTAAEPAGLRSSLASAMLDVFLESPDAPAAPFPQAPIVDLIGVVARCAARGWCGLGRENGKIECKGFFLSFSSGCR